MEQIGRKIKNILLLLFLSFFCKSAMTQRIREVVITKDTIQEFNKNIGIREDTYIEDGLKIYTVDSLNKIISIASYKNNKLDGPSFSFFIDVDMLEEKGMYKANKKHGAWFFWNRNGILLRTELWKNGKLISKKLFTKKK